MSRRRLENLIALTARQRCFWLFALLLMIIVAVPFLEGTRPGRIGLAMGSLAILAIGAGVVVRAMGSAALVVTLAAASAVLLVLSFEDGPAVYRTPAHAFSAAFSFAVTGYLLRYTFQREVLTLDKLYGAAAAFLLLGVAWVHLYAILLNVYPGSLVINGAPLNTLPPSSLVYFSLATLTATGMSDILPVHPVARMVCGLEMTAGVLFLAVLIARLASSYPARE
jgi:hypothetical protein